MIYREDREIVDQYYKMKLDEQLMNEGMLKNAMLGGVLATSLLGAEPESQLGPIASGNNIEFTQELPIDYDTFIKDAMEYIKRNEGGTSPNGADGRWYPYQDSKGIWTIGIGHKILDGEDFSKGLNIHEVMQLFKKDLNSHIERAVNIFPAFHKYPVYVRVGLLDGVYRGDIGKVSGPKTYDHIIKSEWDKVADEYIDSQEYKDSKALGSKHGVWQRMDRNAAKFSQYARVLAYRAQKDAENARQ